MPTEVLVVIIANNEVYMADGQEVWSNEEIQKLWPQAVGELRGFQQHLQVKSALTAGQLSMAIQLAEAGFKTLAPNAPKGEQIGPETLDRIEALLSFTLTSFHQSSGRPDIAGRINTFDQTWATLKSVREKAGRPAPKL